MTTTTGTCNWTNEQTDLNVLGSGADSYPWYLTLIGRSSDHPGAYVVQIGDTKDDAPVVTFTRAQVRQAVRDLLDAGFSFDTDDMDADDMDVVLQTVTLGTIVYG